MKPILDLKQFLIRRQVLQIYKDIFKVLNRIDDLAYRKELSAWTRTDFKRNKELKDGASISIEMTRAKKSLKELQVSMNLAK